MKKGEKKVHKSHQPKRLKIDVQQLPKFMNEDCTINAKKGSRLFFRRTVWDAGKPDITEIHAGVFRSIGADGLITIWDEQFEQVFAFRLSDCEKLDVRVEKDETDTSA